MQTPADLSLLFTFTYGEPACFPDQKGVPWPLATAWGGPLPTPMLQSCQNKQAACSLCTLRSFPVPTPTQAHSSRRPTARTRGWLHCPPGTLPCTSLPRTAHEADLCHTRRCSRSAQQGNRHTVGAKHACRRHWGKKQGQRNKSLEVETGY